jgi:hypothetical protein
MIRVRHVAPIMAIRCVSGRSGRASRAAQHHTHNKYADCDQQQFAQHLVLVPFGCQQALHYQNFWPVPAIISLTRLFSLTTSFATHGATYIRRTNQTRNLIIAPAATSANMSHCGKSERESEV